MAAILWPLVLSGRALHATTVLLYCWLLRQAITSLAHSCIQAALLSVWQGAAHAAEREALQMSCSASFPAAPRWPLISSAWAQGHA